MALGGLLKQNDYFSSETENMLYKHVKYTVGISALKSNLYKFKVCIPLLAG